MAERNRSDREPRWNNTGYWTGRPDEEDWEGDRSLSRNYNRDDQRRYAQKSQEQAERLRRMRGEGEAQGGMQGRSRASGREETGPRDYRRGQSAGQGSAWESGRWDERERYRGYGPDIARGETGERDRTGASRYHGEGRNRGERGQGRDWGWSGRQDDDRDYRTYNRGQDLNMEGNPAWDRDENFSPGFRDADYGGEYRRSQNRYQDPGDTNEYGPTRADRRPFTERDRRGDDDRHSDFDWEVQQGYRTAMDRDWTASGEDLAGNYWGERSRRRRAGEFDSYRDTGRDRDRDRQPNQGGFVSGRTLDTDRDFPYQQDDDEREFDMDPGFAYEFGTDYDFMRDTGRQENRSAFYRQREQSRQEQDRQEQERDQRGASSQRGAAGGRRQQPSRYRDVDFWNASGPYSGIGPSGYTRPDERIKDDICERLTQHGKIDSRKIEIQVQNGEVTLSGHVRRKDEKYLAEDVTESVTGVQNVKNHLRVEMM